MLIKLKLAVLQADVLETTARFYFVHCRENTRVNFFTQILPIGTISRTQSSVRTSAIISLHTVGEIIPVKRGPRAAPAK